MPSQEEFGSPAEIVIFNQRPMYAGCPHSEAWLSRASQPDKLCLRYKRLQCHHTV